MVKKLSCMNFLKSYYKTDLYSKAEELSTLKFSIGGILLIAITNAIINYYSVNGNSIRNTLLITTIGFPLILLIIYSFLFVFINAFQREKGVKFFKSFLIFLLISTQFYLIEYVFELIKDYFIWNKWIYFTFSLLSYIVGLYYLFNLIKTLSKYFKIDWFKILASVLITYLIFATILVTNYILYLISITK